MIALLCGGQGSLSADVFRLTSDQAPADRVFRRATELLGQDPRALVQSSDRAALTVNRTGQILALTAALALHACLADDLPEARVVAGYSVGELAAWSLAGVWSPEDALALAARRAAVMDDADRGKGQLAYVRGLDRSRVAALAQKHGLAMAIVNPDPLMVVGGNAGDIAAFCEAALMAGAIRSAPLDVHIASHTPALTAAVKPVEEALRSVSLHPVAANTILFNAGTAARVFDPAISTADLASDVARTLQWSATLDAVLERQPNRILDLGPGQALVDMARPLAPNLPVRAAQEFRTLDGIKAWVRAN